jgi:diaminohydroxyphosphoribosylaminopyrimidine deaminase/5-amino-6-(5-phosphoribosylamino)uracil reductase
MNKPADSVDERAMRRALELAEKGAGWVSPNPMVGAVVLKGEEILAEGYHAKFGGDHAERIALDRAGEAARGATLYVTLEPCCHHGKTPPCLDRVLESGVSRVVIAMEDPNPLVAGGSIRTLRGKGIQVEVGVCEDQARKLNLPFRSHIERKRPWVTLKYAMTLDGRIATRSGDSRWISNEASRRIAHELRRRNRGVVVGYHTALRDNPSLTCRLECDPPPRQPIRIVLGGKESLPEDSVLVRTASEVPTLHVADRDAQLPHSQCDVERVAVSSASDGTLSLAELLTELHERDIDGLLVEGGGRTLAAFLSAGLADEVYAFVAPKILNDTRALAPFQGNQARLSMGEALSLSSVEVREIEGDALIHGYLSEI